MPCSDAGWPSEFDPKFGPALKERLDRVNRVACELVSQLPVDVKLSREAWEWVQEHQAFDKKEGR